MPSRRPPPPDDAAVIARDEDRLDGILSTSLTTMPDADAHDTEPEVTALQLHMRDARYTYDRWCRKFCSDLGASEIHETAFRRRMASGTMLFPPPYLYESEAAAGAAALEALGDDPLCCCLKESGFVGINWVLAVPYGRAFYVQGGM